VREISPSGEIRSRAWDVKTLKSVREGCLGNFLGKTVIDYSERERKKSVFSFVQ